VSDTPRTDSLMEASENLVPGTIVVRVAFARTLERELIANLQSLSDEINLHADTQAELSTATARISALEGELAQYRMERPCNTCGAKPGLECFDESCIRYPASIRASNLRLPTAPDEGRE